MRKVGLALGLPEDMVFRQPFPGPGLAIRIIGEVTRERLETLRAADWVVIDEIKRSGLYRKVWQSFAILTPISSVGVMGDFRTYGNVVAVRIVESEDGMTADWARVPYDVLGLISRRIVNEVPGVNRVVYDISSKPPVDDRMGVGRVLIVGSGGREHALAWACRRDAPDVAVIVAPGNGGTAGIAENIAVDVDRCARRSRVWPPTATVDLVIIGPDAAAAAGVADACSRARHPRVRADRRGGPHRVVQDIRQAGDGRRGDSDCTLGRRRRRGSRAPERRSSPTSAERAWSRPTGSRSARAWWSAPRVDGGGAALDECLAELRFGDAGRHVVVEELLSGAEVSVFGLSDGRNVRHWSRRAITSASSTATAAPTPAEWVR